MTDTPDETEGARPAPQAAPPPIVEPPQPTPRAPLAGAPFDWRKLPWVPIGIAVAVAVVLGIGLLTWQSMSGRTVDDSAYSVQAYTPSTELISARDRVEAYRQPDTASPIVVVFGQGVTLNVNGRVSRGIGNDWYQIAWNNQTGFVRVADVVEGSGAPPTAEVRERPPPRVEEEKAPDELTDEEEEVAPPPPSTGALGVGDVSWVRQPNARDFARYFPARALDSGQSGNVTLSCIIGGSGRLACSVASESPGGYGFGDAAIGISRQLRVRTRLPDGSDAEGRELRLPLSFRAN